MKQGDVVAVVTIAGEFVGKFYEDQGDSIVLQDPRMLVQQGQNMGFAAGICVTGLANPEEATFQQYVFVTPVNSDIEKAYRSAVSGLVL